MYLLLLQVLPTPPSSAEQSFNSQHSQRSEARSNERSDSPNLPADERNNGGYPAPHSPNTHSFLTQHNLQMLARPDPDLSDVGVLSDARRA